MHMTTPDWSAIGLFENEAIRDLACPFHAGSS